MELSLKLADTLDPVAVTALILSLFQIFVSLIRWWFNRKKISFSANAGMILIGGTRHDNNTYISFRITNIGEKPFMLRSVTMSYWPSRLHKIFKKKSKKSFYTKVADAWGNENAPADIAVGKDWNGMIIEDSEMKLMQAGYLQAEANYSLSQKPAICRIFPNENTKSKITDNISHSDE